VENSIHTFWFHFRMFLIRRLEFLTGRSRRWKLLFEVVSFLGKSSFSSPSGGAMLASELNAATKTAPPCRATYAIEGALAYPMTKQRAKRPIFPIERVASAL
jgi:hypothetical protein